jgi:CheY-like chemotaxis protein/glycine cleavage system H lipoate-binding protein
MENPMSNRSRKKVLIVDDDLEVCEAMRQSLLSEGYDIEKAHSGMEALKQCEQKSYDVVIADMVMPGLSGMDLLATLKGINDKIYVILVTGYPTIPTAVQSIKIGAFDYLTKPFTPKELRIAVRNAIESTDEKKPRKKVELPPQLPTGVQCVNEHLWIRKDGNSRYTIGLNHEFSSTIDSVTRFELPSRNTNIFKGEVCVRLETPRKNVQRIWSPVSGRIVAVNYSIEKRPNIISHDPYRKGWLFQIESQDLDEILQNRKSCDRPPPRIP